MEVVEEWIPNGGGRIGGGGGRMVSARRWRWWMSGQCKVEGVDELDSEGSWWWWNKEGR